MVEMLKNCSYLEIRGRARRKICLLLKYCSTKLKYLHVLLYYSFIESMEYAFFVLVALISNFSSYIKQIKYGGYIKEQHLFKYVITSNSNANIYH